LLTISKYPIPREDTFKLNLPKDAMILTVQNQGTSFDFLNFAKPFIWAVVDTEAPTQERTFVVLATGQEISRSPDSPEINYSYIGTWQDPPNVWHLFEILP
jgi:hypothetical protein